MRFNVRLIDHHKTVSVAQLIKIRRVWIVAGTDSIEVVLFHQGKVCFHLFQADDKSCFRIGIMTVHSAEFDFFSVEKDGFLFDLDGTQTNVVSNDLILCLKNDRV